MELYNKCNVCNETKKESDFIIEGECYKCTYKRKVEEFKKIKKRMGLKKNRQCKVCASQLSNNRWSYCSDSCSRKAKLEYRYWTQKVKTDTKNAKRRFLFYV